MTSSGSENLYQRALAAMPGGVNSPVRAFRGVGGNPIFIERGQGPCVYDTQGKEYIDYVGSWGPLILGHAHPAVVHAMEEALHAGTSFGFATGLEVRLAEKVKTCVPSIEKIRFVNSGTEATMSAVRLARAFTKRDRILKFAGCYHGHADAFLSEAGSGVATLGIPGSAGVPKGAVQDSITVGYNDLDACEHMMREHRASIAAIIVEPVACNMGLVLPEPDFLPGLRKLCDHHGVLLIFDEVITGFRLQLGGAQAKYNVSADLTTFGKIIGGGMPVGAYGGRADIMCQVAPEGPVYQAGTLSGNPLAMSAGLATLEVLEQAGSNAYTMLNQKAEQMRLGLQESLQKHGHPAFFEHMESIFYLWFNKGEQKGPKNYEQIKQANAKRFGAFFHAMLGQGVLLAPSAFEVGFLSLAHEKEHIERTVQAVDLALAKCSDK